MQFTSNDRIETEKDENIATEEAIEPNAADAEEVCEAPEASCTEPEENAGQNENTEAEEKEGEPSSKKKKEEEKESPALFFFDLLELAAMSLAIVMLVLTFIVRQSPVNGNSMYPTIKGRPEYSATEKSGEDVLLISNLFYTPKTGDIVVIQTPTLYADAERSMDHSLVKRVIAVGGDTMTIDFENWIITVNDVVIEEGYGKAPYVNYAGTTMSRGAISSNAELIAATVSAKGNVYTLKIPEGKLFVMGDNRNDSLDSRSIGFVDERWVAGKAILRVYPFDRFGAVE